MIATTPRHLLGLDALTAGDFAALLDLAAIMRRHPLAWRGALEGRAVACLFERPSTRSRVSLEIATASATSRACRSPTSATATPSRSR
jgi:ornithine carbamoyltransferase